MRSCSTKMARRGRLAADFGLPLTVLLSAFWFCQFAIVAEEVPLIGPKLHFAVKNDAVWDQVRRWPLRQWRERLGFSKALCLLLFEMLEPFLQRRTRGPSQTYRNAGRRIKWTPFKCFVLGMIRLRSRSTFLEFRDHWGTTRGGTLVSCLRSFRDAVTSLRHAFIYFPSSVEDLQRSARHFARGWGVDCVGVLDGVHIPFVTADIDFTNRKGNSTMLVLAVVDAFGRFIAAFIGFPGRMNDPGAFRFTSMWRTTLIDLQRLGGFWILCDSIFGGNKSVVPVWDHSDIGPHTPHAKRVCQWAMIRTRSVVERAFGLLFKKFPWLKEMRVDSADEAAAWVEAAMILHNIDRMRFVQENATRRGADRAIALPDPLDAAPPSELATRAVLAREGWLAQPRSTVLGGPADAERIRQGLIERNGWADEDAGQDAW